MSLTKFNQNVNNHQGLPDKPGLSSEELKKLFDKASVDIKEYLNTILTEEVDGIISTLQSTISGNKRNFEGLIEELRNAKVSKSGDTINGILNMLGNAIKFGNNGCIEWKEDGYGDKFRIIPDFTGDGSSNKLLIQSTVGGEGTDPTNWKTIAYISADNGKLYILGDIDTTGHLHAYSEIGVRTANATRHIIIGDGNGGFTWIDHRDTNSNVKNNIMMYDEFTQFGKPIHSEDFVGKVNGYQFDLGTENTSDSWLPILANDKIQHRTIDNIISAYNLAKQSGDQVHSANLLTAINQIYSYGDLYSDGSVRFKGILNQAVSASGNVFIENDGFLRKGINYSSKRYKKDIKELEKEEFNPERLYDLKVKQFKYKKDYQPNEKDSRYDKDLVGFIAEEVAEIYPIAADYNENGEVENWNDRYIIPPMLALIQSQKKKIDELEKRIETLENK